MSRRLLAAARMALSWGVILALAGPVVGFFFLGIRSGFTDFQMDKLFNWAVFGGTLGLIGGAGFAAFLATQGNARSINELSRRRVLFSGTTIGAVAGIIAFVILTVLFEGSIARVHPGVLIPFGLISGLLGLGTSAGILAMAKRGKELAGGGAELMIEDGG